MARLALGTICVTAAFKIDSCAPMPTPQSAMPTSSAPTLWHANTNTANGAESTVDHTSACTPFLSYSKPNTSAATASTSIAPAYSSGSDPLLTSADVCARPEARCVYVRETCMSTSE